MIHSVKTKMIMLLFGSVVTFVLVTLILNSTLLKPYYRKMKEQSLSASFSAVCQLDFNSESIDTQLRSIEENDNVQILIINYRYRVFFCSSSVSDSLFLPTGDNDGVESGEKWFNDWLLPDSSDGSSVEIFSTKPRFSTPYNSVLSASYLSLYAKAIKEINGARLPFYIIINIPTTAIDDNVQIANSFAVLVGALVLLVGAVATVIAGKRLTEPLVEVSNTAKRMTQMIFDEKLNIRSSDEIGEIAGSINTLSSQLKDKINELSVTNEKLKQELEHREKIDNMRRDFISDVSHELKTPLSIILGYCEGLQLNVNSEEREFYCSIIEDEAIRMSKLAEKLLKLAELESGEVMPEIVRFDLADMVKGRLLKLSYLLEERGIVSHFGSAGNTMAYGDYDRIEEVINNLLTNAKNHTPDNGSISAVVREDGSNVYCEVYNSGSHIPEESLDRIWDSFYKVDKSRTRSYGGSGLGLKIVSTILQSHNASFGAANTDDGVKFWFSLKLAEPDDDASAAESE